MGSNCPCKYKCGNAKITFTKDGKTAKAVRENDKFSITIEPYRNELDVNENKIKRVPYEPKNKFKISAYAGSHPIECDPQEPDYSWKVEKDENEKIIKVSGEITNFSFVEPPPDDKPFVNVDVIFCDPETPGEGACGSESIYLTTTTCYYIYRYTKKWLTSTSTCEAIVKQAGYDEAEVELYAVRCEDPETTDLVESDWVLIDSGATNEYNYCIFECIVTTEDACVDAVIARAVNENDTVEGDENGDGIVNKYDFCIKEEELKPEPPSENQLNESNCNCGANFIDDYISAFEDFADGVCYDLADDYIPTFSDYSFEMGHNIIYPSTMSATSKRLRIWLDVDAEKLGDINYQIKITVFDLNDNEFVRTFTVTDTSVLSKTIDNYNRDWGTFSVEVTDHYQDTYGCVSNGKITGTISFEFY